VGLRGRQEGLPTFDQHPAHQEHARHSGCRGKNANVKAMFKCLVQNDQKEEEDAPQYELKSMMWGLVPAWFQGTDPKKTGLTTNNARLENIQESKLYSPHLKAGRRCVVICDGFYEWKAPKEGQKGGGKQPYLLYADQNGSQRELCDAAKCTLKQDVEEDSGEWKGPKVLMMAGIYSIWKGKEGEEPLLSYSIITREANSVISWLHHRVPAVLADADAAQCWLDGELSSEEALKKAMKPLTKGQLHWHPVDKDVGNVKNQGEEICKEVELDKEGKQVIANV